MKLIKTKLNFIANLKTILKQNYNNLDFNNLCLFAKKIKGFHFHLIKNK